MGWYMIWWRMMFNMLKGVLGIATFAYSGTTPTTLIDPRTGLPAVGIPTYSSVTAAETALPAVSNGGNYMHNTGVCDAGILGVSLWRSNGTVWFPVNAPVYTYSAALALCNSNAAGYTGAKFTLSDVANAVHRFDGTNLVPLEGICRLAGRSARIKFTAPSVAAASASNSGGFVKLAFGSAHNLTDAAVGGANLVVRADGNGFTAGQRLGIVNIAAQADPAKEILTNLPWDAAYVGAPTLAVINNDFIMETITIPPLHINSGIDIRNLMFGANPRAGNKVCAVRYNSTSSNIIMSLGITTTYGLRASIGFRNRGVASSQIALGSTVTSGDGLLTSGDAATFAVDTSGTTTLYIMGNIVATVNEYLALDAYDIYKVG